MTPRYELRYFVSPERALQVRDFVREYLDFDEHSVGKPEFSYPVHTLHLDSDDWKLYWRAMRGDQDRWKLRLRYYSSDPGSPVFCEVKHQMTERTVKHRGGVRVEAVKSVLAGYLPDREGLLTRNPREVGAVERFVAMMGELNARPRLHIGCLREAYESYDGKARVTLDRCIGVDEVPADSGELLPTAMDNPLKCLNQVVILVLRFTERFPHWYRELVEIFELTNPALEGGDEEHINCGSLRLSAGDLIHNVVL